VVVLAATFRRDVRETVHLLISSVGDVTSDLICERLAEDVLRLNWERWNEYSIELDKKGFRIADCFGRVVTEKTIGNIIWRKPVATVDTEPGEFWYCFHEFKNAVESIISQIRLENQRKIPIDPLLNATADKFKQLRVASQHLTVPPWRFTTTPSKHIGTSANVVTKSVTGQPIPGTGDFSKVIYTTTVDPTELADGFPWFLQQEIQATHDLTVVYVGGQHFAFTLDRNLFSGMDWRKSIGTDEVDESWQATTLPKELTDSLSNIMNALGLRFGRIDLLAFNSSCDDVVFLEVNPNGQWAWLDPFLENGLFDAVVDFLISR